MWDAISNFISEYLGIFYHSDDDVCNDQELQSWAKDINENGLPRREGAHDICNFIFF
jgi:hypothetical protein